MYIFLDESGDLSFNMKSTRYFIIACVITKDVLGTSRIARKVFRSFLRKEKKKRKGKMLHANNETDQTRNQLFKLVANHKQSDVAALIIKKEKIPKQMQNEKHFLYNHATERLLDTIITQYPPSVGGELTLVTSRRETKKHLNKMFTEHIQKRVLQNHSIEINIDIKHPASRTVTTSR